MLICSAGWYTAVAGTSSQKLSESETMAAKALIWLALKSRELEQSAIKETFFHDNVRISGCQLKLRRS